MSKVSSTPLVSIITPSYNQAGYIEQTIQSVKLQDYPRIEHIVVDGGSSDGTKEILSRHPHLHWTSEKDSGQSDAINKGFKRAKGEIIGWLNSDDVYASGAVRRSVEYFLDNPDVDLIYTDFNYIDEEGKFLFTEKVEDFSYQRQLNAVNLIPQPTVFFRSKVFDMGYLDESYHYAMDYEYWLRLGKKFTITKIDGINANFRLQPESKTVTELKKFYPEVFRISRKYGGKLFSQQNVNMALGASRQLAVIGRQRLKRALRKFYGRPSR